MRIAIIDSGIDKKHKKIRNPNVNGVSIKLSDKDEIVYDFDYHDEIGHGSACASIISKFDSSSELVAVKIFHKNLTSKEILLVKAIEWCANNNIQIINISLGIETNSPSIALTNACAEVVKKGIIIISAHSNDINTKSYPASYPWVFGVLGGKCKSTEYGYKTIKDIGCFIAKGSLQRVAWNNLQSKIVTGSSYATAHITGIICKKLQECQFVPTYDVLKQILINESKEDVDSIQYGWRKNNSQDIRILSQSDEEAGCLYFVNEKKFDWINNIGVFPVSEKEMKQFVDFPNLCVKKVAKLMDFPRTFNSFKLNSENIIYHFPTKEVLDEIDTLVFGYFIDNLWELNIEHGKKIVELAIRENKNFFVYDVRLYNYLKNNEAINKSNCKVYCPIVDYKTYDLVNSYSYLPTISKPILCVIGTSNKQGKFTTQLRVGEILKKAGYKISFLSTEPQGELFGADFSFPFGYMGTVDLKAADKLNFLRNIIKCIAKYNNPDIIITGIQGGISPRNALNAMPDYNSIDSLTFLHGVLPDIVICAINPEDSIEIIENAVNTASVFSKCKTILFVMTPWERTIFNNGINKKLLCQEEKIERITFFQDKLKTPVIDIMDCNNDSLILKLIQDACS